MAATDRGNPLKDKSYAFALRIVNVYKHLLDNNRKYVLSKQLLRSGTSVGANIVEANQAQSRRDFASKLSIALKETVKTEFWLSLLRDSQYLTDKQANALMEDCVELKKMLTSAIKTTRSTIR